MAYKQSNCTVTFASEVWANPTLQELTDWKTYYDLYITLLVTFYIGKYTHLEESLKYWSQEIVEKGFIKKWESDIIPRKNYNDLKEVLKEDETVITLKLEHFDVVFKMLAMGYSISAGMLILEILYKTLDNRFQVTEHMIVFVVFMVKLLKPPPVNT